jgi:hypothetical protein
MKSKDDNYNLKLIFNYLKQLWNQHLPRFFLSSCSISKHLWNQFILQNDTFS